MLHALPGLRSIGAAACAVALCTGIALAQSDVSVTLNGAPLQLNPSPEVRAGRVFVPLRGIFERLGASVVYDGGTINAQGNGHAVSLHIGSTQATVDGQIQNLDVAPFIVGASTYVPLRFVSQALGASVNYDASNRIVALGGGGPSQAQQDAQAQQRAQGLQRAQAQRDAQAQQVAQDQQRAQELQRARDQQAALDQKRAQDLARAQTQQQPSPLTFATVRPGREEAVTARRPTIEADFGGAQADPNSIRVTLDGLNITDDASRSPRGVVFSPASDLQSGRHDVRIAGTDTNGRKFDGSWTFASGTSPVVNAITDLRPGNGSSVRGQFVVAGHTLPGARVVVQVGTVDRPRSDNLVGQLFGAGGNGGSESVRSEVTADGNGNFQVPISIQARPGVALTLVVDSTDAQTKSAAPRMVRNLTVE
jgi:hypothetical protein